MPKINIKLKKRLHFDQEIEVSDEEFETLKDLDYDDVSENSKAYHIIESYINYSNVLDSDPEFEDVTVTRARKLTPKNFDVHSTYFSVLIEDEEKSISLWMDVEVKDKDVSCEWNTHYASVPVSKEIAEYQGDIDNFEEYSSLAINYLVSKNLIDQNSSGEWIIGKA